MADRGFTIADYVAFYHARLAIPDFTKGKKQLHPPDVETTRKIARVRIHAERVIGLVVRKFRIFDGEIPPDLLPSTHVTARFNDVRAANLGCNIETWGQSVAVDTFVMSGQPTRAETLQNFNEPLSATVCCDNFEGSILHWLANLRIWTWTLWTTSVVRFFDYNCSRCRRAHIRLIETTGTTNHQSGKKTFEHFNTGVLTTNPLQFPTRFGATRSRTMRTIGNE